MLVHSFTVEDHGTMHEFLRRQMSNILKASLCRCSKTLLGRAMQQLDRMMSIEQLLMHQVTFKRFLCAISSIL